MNQIRTRRTTIEHRICGRCDGVGKVGVDRNEPCPVCVGSGRVFERETVVIEEDWPLDDTQAGDTVRVSRAAWNEYLVARDHNAKIDRLLDEPT